MENINFTIVRDLPFNLDELINITILDITREHLLFGSEDNVYKIRTPFNDSWDKLTLEEGDKVVVSLETYGLNNYKTKLSYHFKQQSEVIIPIEIEEPSEAQPDTIDEPSEYRPRKLVTPHIKHKWTSVNEDSLSRFAEEGMSVKDMADNSRVGFTYKAIEAKLYRLGWGVRKGIPYRRS